MAGWLGGPIRAECPAIGGFTPSIASVVAGDRSRLFVKAGPDELGAAVEAGAILAGAVGDLSPRLVGFATAGSWRVAAYEVLDGEPVGRWTDDDLAPLAAVLQRMREVLDPSPLAGTSPFAPAFRPMLGTWRALTHSGGAHDATDRAEDRHGADRHADGRSAADRAGADQDATAGRPAAGRPAAGRPAAARPAVDHLRGRRVPFGVPVEWLAELEGRWMQVLTPGTALHHGDLRRDNVIRQPGGRLRIVDWTHLWTAPAWMDLIRLAPDLAACGHDPEALLRRSPWSDAPPGDVDVALAGLAGRAWRDGLLPGPPRLRRMQREQAGQLLGWLASRRAA